MTAPAGAIAPAAVDTPGCVHCWTAASRITDPTDLGWVTHDRIADVVDWLHSHGCRRARLTPETREALNEGLPAVEAVAPQEPDVRDCIPRVTAMVEQATGVHLTKHARWVLTIGVIDADLLLSADTGRGPAIKLLHRLDHARDSDSNRGGGLRGVLASTPGVRPHEARLIARLLLGTATLDRTALPLHYAGHSTRLGASAALVCGVLQVPAVSQRTALAWAHAAKRAIDPTITRTDMRRLISDPIRRTASRAAEPVILTEPAAEMIRARSIAS